MSKKKQSQSSLRLITPKTMPVTRRSRKQAADSNSAESIVIVDVVKKQKTVTTSTSKRKSTRGNVGHDKENEKPSSSSLSTSRKRSASVAFKQPQPTTRSKSEATTPSLTKKSKPLVSKSKAAKLDKESEQKSPRKPLTSIVQQTSNSKPNSKATSKVKKIANQIRNRLEKKKSPKVKKTTQSAKAFYGVSSRAGHNLSGLSTTNIVAKWTALRDILVKKTRTRKQVAEDLGVSYGTVNKWVTNKTKIYADHAFYRKNYDLNRTPPLTVHRNMWVHRNK